MVLLEPIRFRRSDPSTAFENLIDRPEYRDALFLFGDNFEDRNRQMKGGNSAVIRPYSFLDVPRAVGVSTGWSTSHGGFDVLGPQEKRCIVLCFEYINTVIRVHGYRRIIYSCDADDSTKFGFAIFKPCQEVVDFLNDKLKNIPNRASTPAVSTQAIFRGEEELVVPSPPLKRKTASFSFAPLATKFAPAPPPKRVCNTGSMNVGQQSSILQFVKR